MGKIDKTKLEEKKGEVVERIMKKTDLSLKDMMLQVIDSYEKTVRNSPFIFENDRKFLRKDKTEVAEFISRGETYRRLKEEVYESRNRLTSTITWYIKKGGSWKMIHSGSMFSNKVYEFVPYHAVDTYNELVRL